VDIYSLNRLRRLTEVLDQKQKDAKGDVTNLELPPRPLMLLTKCVQLGKSSSCLPYAKGCYLFSLDSTHDHLWIYH